MKLRSSLAVMVVFGLLVGLVGCEAMPMDGDPNDMDSAMGAVGDSTAGKAFFDNNGCSMCHGTGSGLNNASSTTIFNKLSGATSHDGGTFNGVTQDDADDLAAYFDTL